MVKKHKTYFKKAWKDDHRTFTAIFAEDEDFELPLRACSDCGKISCSIGISNDECGQENKQASIESWRLIGKVYGRSYQENAIPKEIIATNKQSPFANKAAKPTDPTNKKAKGRASKKKKSDGTW
jgi:hypothetical protein